MPSNELSPSEDVRPALNATSPRLLIEAQVKLNGLKLSRALSATLVNVCGAACAVAASSMNSPSAKMASAPRTKCSAASACPRTRRLCVMTPPFLARPSPAARTEQRGPSSVSPLNRLAGSTVCFFERFPNDSCSGSTDAASVGAAQVTCTSPIDRPPIPPDLSHQRRVHDQVPKRPDRRHVGAPEQPVPLHENGHLAVVAAGPVRDPADVHHPVHGPVDDLGGPLVVEQVERGEGKPVEVRAWCLPQIHRQPVEERRPLRAVARVRVIPAEQFPDLPPDHEKRAGDAGGARRRVARGDLLHQPREVVRAARRRQRPYVREPEVARELVDSPGPGGVRAVREPHRGSASLQSRSRGFVTLGSSLYGWRRTTLHVRDTADEDPPLSPADASNRRIDETCQ